MRRKHKPQPKDTFEQPESPERDEKRNMEPEEIIPWNEQLVRASTSRRPKADPSIITTVWR